MPLFAAWVHGGRANEVPLASGEAVDLAAAFRMGLLAGTDPASGEYWGDIGDRDQRIVEAADIALAPWLFRDTVWQELTAAQRSQVVRWLSQVDGRRTHDNNWHLFVVLVERVLDTLGVPIADSSARQGYARLRSSTAATAGSVTVSTAASTTTTPGAFITPCSGSTKSTKKRDFKGHQL